MLKIEISTDGAAFAGEDPEDGGAEGYGEAAEECARILRGLAGLLQRTAPDAGSGRLFDVNGNTCGSWVLS